MTNNIQYKKYLADILYQDALRTSKAELQEVSFFQEETTENWTLKQFQIQYVKDQISFFEGGNLDAQVNETWNLIFNNEENNMTKEQQIINKIKAWLQGELSEVINNPLYEDDDSRESALLEGRYECAEGLLGQIKSWEKDQ